MPLDNTTDPDIGPVIDVGGATPLPPGSTLDTSGKVGAYSTEAKPAPMTQEDVDKETEAEKPAPMSAADVKLERALQYGPMIAAAAKKYNIPDDLLPVLHKQAEVESDFDPSATSKAGAKGVFQLMPGTAKDLGVSDPTDPAQNIDGGVKYMGQLLEQFHGNVGMALRAYNAGPNQPSRWNNPETNSYVDKILPTAGPEAQAQDQALQAALKRPSNWGFPEEAFNSATLGLAKAAQATQNDVTGTTGDSWRQEQDLLQAQQGEYKANNQGGAMLADALGFIAPGIGEYKAAMAGGRALARAVPALAPYLTTGLGLGVAGSRGTGGFAGLVRSPFVGAAQAALGSQADPSDSVGYQAAVGGAMGPIGYGVGSAIGGIGAGLAPAFRRATYSSDDWMKAAQQRVGSLLANNDAPAGVDSTIPGVERTLAEQLMGAQKGGVPEVTKLQAQLSKAMPEISGPKIESNNTARQQHFATVSGGPEDIQTATDKLEELGPIAKQMLKKQQVNLNQKDNSFLAGLKEKIRDPVTSELDEYQTVLHRILGALYRDPAKKVATADDIDEKDIDDIAFPRQGEFDEDALEKELGQATGETKSVLKTDAAEVFGVRKLLQHMLDLKDQKVGSLDKTSRAAVTDMLGHVDDILEEKVPAYQKWREAYAGIAKKRSEMQLLQEKGISDVNAANAVNPLAGLQKMIKMAPTVSGVMSKKAMAKNVSEETSDKIDEMLEDALIARQANAAHSGNMGQATHEHTPNGLLHWASGALGSGLGGAAGHFLGSPGGETVGGTLGWVGGTTGHAALMRAAGQNSSAFNKATLKALLYPDQYPAIMPKAGFLPKGTVSSGVGGAALNSLLNGGAGATNVKATKSASAQYDEKGQGDTFVRGLGGFVSGNEDSPYTRNFASGSFPLHSNPNSPRLESAMTKGVSLPTELPDDEEDFVNHAMEMLKQSKIPLTKNSVMPQHTQDTLRKVLRDEFNATRRSPIARLGFDLDHSIFNFTGNSYGDESGAYYPDKDVLHAMLSDPGTLTHESIHRGIQKLREAGLVNIPGEELGHLPFEEEYLVRGIMHDTMGDVQKGITPKKYNDWVNGPRRSYQGDNGELYRKVIDTLNRAATKHILAQRAQGKRSDY